MGIRRRLLAAFVTVIGLLLTFAIYQTWVYYAISQVNSNAILLSGISENIETVRQGQATYLELNARRYIGMIDESIQEIKLQSQELLASGVLSKEKTRLSSLSDYYLAYETGLKAFISTNDQYHALKVTLEDMSNELYQLVESMPEALLAHQPSLGVDPHKILVLALQYAAGDYLTTTDEIPALKALVVIGNGLMSEKNDFELRLFGRRLATLARENQETLERKDAINLENQALLYRIDQELANLYNRISEVRISEQAYASRLILQLQVGYWTIFALSVLVVFTLVLRLSRRIASGVKELVSSAERIASGDYSSEVNLAGSDEFSSIANHINKMMEALRMANLSVKTYSNQLEHLVSAKTRELKRANEKLEELNDTLATERNRYASLALTDMLTGLNNRAYFMEALNQKIDEAKRYGKTFSLLLLDIDHFKNVNDQYGHLVGDAVLKQFSKLLKRETRVSDIVARYGGEEFMVIFTEASLSKSLQISERIRHATLIEAFEEEKLKVSISGGLVTYNGESEAILLKRVDDLLYTAKREGRNRICSAANT